MRRKSSRITKILGLLVVFLAMVSAAFGQQTPRTETTGAEEIPLERCDVLPVVRVQVGQTEMRFLVDTGATTILNLGSFTGTKTSDVRVSSWSGTVATSARQVELLTLRVGSHELKGVKLPAIDLSPIGKACGGKIDGILGVDLLDKLGVTIDLRKQVASFQPEQPPTAREVFDRMETDMHSCASYFEHGNAKALEDCFDPEIVLYSPDGEYHGKKQAVEYLQAKYMKYAPNLTYKMLPHDVQLFGDALWYSYEYEIDAPGLQVIGHGMSMCRKNGGKWVVLNLHNSLLGAAKESGLAKSE